MNEPTYPRDLPVGASISEALLKVACLAGEQEQQP